MDIRNFTNQEIPPYKKGCELEFLYDLHKGLLDKYLDIEKLPTYPINVNTRKGQSIIKDMSARVIEEIGEGFESTTLALQMLDKNGFNFSIWSRDDYNMLLNHLQNSNEEQADALAFYFNLLMYSNIQPEDIYAYCNDKKLTVNGVYDLNDLMLLGYNLQIARVTNTKTLDEHAWNVFSPSIYEVVYGDGTELLLSNVRTITGGEAPDTAYTYISVGIEFIAVDESGNTSTTTTTTKNVTKTESNVEPVKGKSVLRKFKSTRRVPYNDNC